MKVSLNKNIDLSDNGSIKFGKTGKTNITKDKLTSKELIAQGDNNTISINKNDSGTITGLTNKTWDPNYTKANIISGRAATEDQLLLATQKFT